MRRHIALPRGSLLMADRRRLFPLPDLVGRLAASYRRDGHLLADGDIGIWRTADDLLVQATIDPTHHGSLLHVSFSYRDHLPSWRDVQAVRATFFPASIDVMQVLPREGYYVNVHPYTLHLWEMPEKWDIS